MGRSEHAQKLHAVVDVSSTLAPMWEGPPGFGGHPLPAHPQARPPDPRQRNQSRPGPARFLPSTPASGVDSPGLEVSLPDRALLIDDDRVLGDQLRRWLEPRGLLLEQRPTAAAGLAALGADGGPYDLLLLDLSLPDMDGLDLCRAARARGLGLPILMLTARGDTEDRVLGLELGADDYLPKPFDPRELLARARALLRRARPAPGGRALRFGALRIDPDAGTVQRDGALLPLTAHQHAILWALASRAGRTLSRAQIAELVDLGLDDALDRAVDVQISRIRALIEAEPRQPRHLLTVRGVGYRFSPGDGEPGGG